MMFTSISIILLGVLPSDVRAIRVANSLMICVLVVNLLWVSLATVLLARRGLQGDIPRLHRSIWCVPLCLLIAGNLARMTKASSLPPRERLDQVWRVFGQFLVLFGLMFLF